MNIISLVKKALDCELGRIPKVQLGHQETSTPSYASEESGLVSEKKQESENNNGTNSAPILSSGLNTNSSPLTIVLGNENILLPPFPENVMILKCLYFQNLIMVYTWAKNTIDWFYV